MEATFADIKALTHIQNTTEEGVVKNVYKTKIDWLDKRRLWAVGEELIDMTIGKLRHEGYECSDEHADFDLMPSPDGDGVLVLISVAITEEGRKLMTEALEA